MTSNLAVFLFTFLPISVFGCGGIQMSQDPYDALGQWHQRHLDCGHPSFTYRLPMDIQNKIRAVWANYVAGDECDKEKTATALILQSIPDEIRFKVFHGMCGPAFLKDATPAIRTQFQNIWFDEKLSLDEKETEFKKLGYSLLTGDALKKFNEFESELQERKKARQQTIDGLSSAARTAYDKWNQMRKDERLYLSSLPEEVRAELKLVCTFCGTHKIGQTANAHRRLRRNAYLDGAEVHHFLRAANDAAFIPPCN